MGVGSGVDVGVYSLAAQQLIPDMTAIQAAYWFATTRSGFQFAPPGYFDITDGDVRERFREGWPGFALRQADVFQAYAV